MFDDVRLHSQGRTFIFPVGFGGGKSPIPAFPKGKEFYPNVFARGGLVNCPFCERVKYQLRVTPTANRNSYRVAMIGGVDTQGSVLRPQPWAGESQLLQSCQDKPHPNLPQGEGAHRQPFQPSSRGLSLIGGHSNLHQVEQV